MTIMQKRYFKVLQGKILSSVENVNNQEIIFTTVEGKRYKLYHDQNCCETVSIEDICGDLQDLVGSKILQAEEVTHNRNELPHAIKKRRKGHDSFMWTFYKIATRKGFVTIRWYGASNGYYSEAVDFVQEIKTKTK